MSPVGGQGEARRRTVCEAAPRGQSLDAGKVDGSLVTSPSRRRTMNAVLGIDVAKASLEVALILADKPVEHRQFSNDRAGFKALKGWLAKRGVQNLQVCMEATGTFSEAVACFLYGQGHTVSVVNPARIS